jgi:ATP-binding cassette subfamily B protein
MIATSFSEIFSIGAVLPFLAVLTAPESVYQHPIAQPIIHLLGVNSSGQMLLPLTIVFGIAALMAGAMRLLLLWSSTKLSYAVGADLSISIYQRTLYQPYSVHVSRNSSDVINGIASKTNIVIGSILSVLNLISSIIILVAILFALLSINPIVAFVIFGGFGLIYYLIVLLTRKSLLVNSRHIANESTQLIKFLQEGLGGIRDVLLDGSQSEYCKKYQNADFPLRRAQGNNMFISSSPRSIMETLGMLLISVFAYMLAQQPDGITKAIPVLGALALGAQRLLPVLQQGYGSWSSVKGTQITIQDTLELLEQPLPEYAIRPDLQSISFIDNIKLKNISFRYTENSGWILKNIDLNIIKGSRIGFMGTTGSGKSTLLDIVMGLLNPTEGILEIDDTELNNNNQRAWQAHIAHVPQSIFLADTTIEENIALGVPKNMIDHDRVKAASQQAQIADIIESWPKKYQTFVGERGIRLSGGQRQRIGIARALYKQADVIIFDEATSALDNETESAVMQSIESLHKDLTLLIIAHRLTTLKNCSTIIELGDGGIIRSGRYTDLVKIS